MEILKEKLSMNDILVKFGYTYVSKCSYDRSLRKETIHQTFVEGKIVESTWNAFGNQNYDAKVVEH